MYESAFTHTFGGGDCRRLCVVYDFSGSWRRQKTPKVASKVLPWRPGLWLLPASAPSQTCALSQTCSLRAGAGLFSAPGLSDWFCLRRRSHLPLRKDTSASFVPLGAPGSRRQIAVAGEVGRPARSHSKSEALEERLDGLSDLFRGFSSENSARECRSWWLRKDPSYVASQYYCSPRFSSFS